MKSSQKLKQFKQANLNQFENFIALSNDDKMLLSSFKGVLTFNAFKAKPKTVKSFTVNNKIQFQFFHPTKNNMILVCDKNQIYYIDCLAKQKKCQYGNKSSEQLGIKSMASNAELFASLHQKQILIFKLKNFEKIKILEIVDAVQILFHPTCNILIIGLKNSQILFYDIEKNINIKTIIYKDEYGDINQIKFSPKGSIMALGFSSIPDIIICDGQSGNKLKLLTGLSKYKFSHDCKTQETIQISSNDQFLALKIKSEYILIFSLKQGDLLIELNVNQIADYISFTFTSDNIFLDIQSKKVPKTIFLGKTDDTLKFIRLLNDELDLLCCFSKSLAIFEVKTGNKLQTFNYFHEKFLNCCDFSFNGQKLIINQDDAFSIWEVNYKKIHLVLEKIIEQPLKFLVFSKANQLIIQAVDGCGYVLIQDCKQENKQNSISSILKFQKINILRLSKSGILLALGREDYVIHLWNLQKLELFTKLEIHKYKIQAIDIQDDDQQLLSCEENIIYLWDIAVSQIVKTFNFNLSLIQEIFFSSDGQAIYLFYPNQSIYQININQQENLQILYEHSNIITCVKISPDRKYILIGNEDGRIYKFDLISKTKTKEFQEHDDQIIDISFSPDENIFASLSKDETICYWKINLGIMFEKLICIKDVITINFMNKDVLAYGCNDGTIKIIQFFRQNIRPFNQCSNLYPKYFQGYDTTFENAEITSIQGYNLAGVLKNQF